MHGNTVHITVWDMEPEPSGAKSAVFQFHQSSCPCSTSTPADAARVRSPNGWTGPGLFAPRLASPSIHVEAQGGDHVTDLGGGRVRRRGRGRGSPERRSVRV